MQLQVVVGHCVKVNINYIYTFCGCQLGSVGIENLDDAALAIEPLCIMYVPRACTESDWWPIKSANGWSVQFLSGEQL